jgi:diacylglycerol kinase family enzyme
MRVIVLMNPIAGIKPADTARQVEALRVTFSEAGVDADVRPACPAELPGAAREAARDATADAVIAAGGDGTVSTVAAALVDHEKPLGIVPVGTLNHFARDLGLPPTPRDAAAVIAQQNVRRVDVGQVNDRTFINNSSIGLYPQIVGERDDIRQRLAGRKVLATLVAAARVFRRHPTVRVRIGVGDQSVLRTTPVVFVGDNRYEMHLTMLGRRQRLDGGELCVYVVNRAGRFGLLSVAVRALLGLAEQARDFDILTVPELWIETPRKRLGVALDGEVIHLSPPLHYRIRPLSLRVLAPPATAAAETEKETATTTTETETTATTPAPGSTGERAGERGDVRVE